MEALMRIGRKKKPLQPGGPVKVAVESGTAFLFPLTELRLVVQAARRHWDELSPRHAEAVLQVTRALAELDGVDEPTWPCCVHCRGAMTDEHRKHSWPCPSPGCQEP
jgi:hypothetical protein